ncbi:MAG: phosphate ABC transporter substrate-binding protein [Actinomycetota bacterium]
MNCLKRRKWLFLSIPLLLLLILTLNGCRAGTERDAAFPKEARRIKISGSRTCLPLFQILAEAYRAKHPDVEIVFLPGAHSGAGVAGANNGTLDIGLVSRELKPEEAKLGLKYYVVSLDGLAIFTNPSIKIKNLTTNQIKGIYAGEITNWKDVGGPDEKIIVLDRAEDESAKIILREYVLGSIPTTPSATLLYFETDMVKALETTPNAIGYLSLGYAISHSLRLNMISVDGKAPSVKNIYSGKYQVVRPLGIVVKKEPAGIAKAFLDYVFGKEGRKVMEKNGYAAVKRD